MTTSCFLYAGTHRRAYRADPTDIAFGIYAFRRDLPGREFEPLGVTRTLAPGWIAAHPSGRTLYALSEVPQNEGPALHAFAIGADGALTWMNSRALPAMPCHCSVDATGRFVVVATFGGGSVHLFTLESDGSLKDERDVHFHVGASVHPKRQTHPHAHAAVIAPGNRFVVVPDLGMDQVVVYELAAEAARLVARPELSVRLPAGSGPRHIVFDPAGRFAWLVNEISADITTFTWDADRGQLAACESVDLLPAGFAGLRSGGALLLHPDGHRLYATTRSRGSSAEPPVRGLDSLVWFAIDPTTGRLALEGRIPSGGEIPRALAFDPACRQLLVGHQGSAAIVGFDIDADSGAPVPTATRLDTPVPVCLCLVTPPHPLA